MSKQGTNWVITNHGEIVQLALLLGKAVLITVEERSSVPEFTASLVWSSSSVPDVTTGLVWSSSSVPDFTAGLVWSSGSVPAFASVLVGLVWSDQVRDGAMVARLQLIRREDESQ